MRTINLGILAHVDAGKTSLTERLLYESGVIPALGSVDSGSTQTDTLALERRRGITIKSAVVSFTVDDTKINLIDTPGHPDFIAEVERVLGVLDGVVLVVSAVEGVQAQTRILMRTLRRLAVPTVLFVNKIDRRGALERDIVGMIIDRLQVSALPMGTVRNPGSRVSTVEPKHAVDHRLAARVGRCAVHPVFFGSAITGAGVGDLTAGIVDLLPSAEDQQCGAFSGSVFKIERIGASERETYVRTFTGTLRVRDRVGVGLRGTRTVTGLVVFADGRTHRVKSVGAGEIAVVRGLIGAQIGDSVGAPRTLAGSSERFAPPTLETVVLPRDGRDRRTLHDALGVLAEQDPLINVRHDVERGELAISLFGEVQKEVIAATLADDFGIEVTFEETTTVCIERVIGCGAAAEVISIAPNPFLATVGLRVEPGPIGGGITYRLEVELGSMPIAFMRAIEDTVRSTLRAGLAGWEVQDCVVTLTHTGYYPRQSHAHARFDKSMSSTGSDFRGLTPLVLMAALREARTRVCEPIHRARLEVPAESLAAVAEVLRQTSAMILAQSRSGSLMIIEAEIRAARLHTLAQLVPGATLGEGVVESTFDRYETVRGVPPTRIRPQPDALNRKDYLALVTR